MSTFWPFATFNFITDVIVTLLLQRDMPQNQQGFKETHNTASARLGVVSPMERGGHRSWRWVS